MLELAGTRWRVDDVAGHGVLGEAHPDIEFAADGHAFGRATVNRWRATWTLHGDQLRLGQGVRTMMAGPPAHMEQEERWMQFLGQPLTVRSEPPSLLLVADDGTLSRLVALDRDEHDGGSSR